MKIEVHPDDDLVARKAAAIIAVDARAAVSSRGRFIMAVSGGHTPWLMFGALADQQVPWESVHVVQVDERAAPVGDPDRNLSLYLRASLLDHAPLLPNHIHAMPVEAADLNGAAQQYAETLQDLAGSSPVLDLVHLGLGADGHTASLVPGRSGARFHRRRRRSDPSRPGPAPDDADVSDHQPITTRSVAGDRPREGWSARAPARQRSFHSCFARASGSCADSPTAQRRDSSAPTRTWRRKNEHHHHRCARFAPSDDQRAIGPIVDQLHSRRCSRWMRFNRQSRGIPARRWRWRRSSTRSGTASCASIRKTPFGKTATGSCSPTGHASMLLWSVLHLHRHPRGECRIRTARTARGVARRYSSLSPARQQGPRSPRIPLGLGGRGHDRPTRAGNCHERRDGHRRKMAFQSLQSAGPRDLRLQHLCGLRRRLHDGGRGWDRKRCSLAGHLALDNLCWIYDNNHITIEGEHANQLLHGGHRGPIFWVTGGNVLRVGDADDIDRIERALDTFRKTKERPTFIILDSHIGYGSPHRQDTAAAHGEPLGEEEVRLTERDDGSPEDPRFRLLKPFATTSLPALERGACKPVAVGPTLHRIPVSTSGARKRYRLMHAVSFRPDGMPGRRSSADPKGIAGRDASGKVLTYSRRIFPGCWADLPIWARPTKPL